MLLPLLRLVARLPLKALHRAGAALGWLAYWFSPTYARHLKENLYASGMCGDGPKGERLLHEVISETGKGTTELVAVWFGSDQKLAQLVTCDTWHVAEYAQREGRGIMFLTPHLGCFEAAGFYAAQRMPITIMYRPPKLRWLEPLMITGRARGHARLAPANVRGVRMLYRALQNGEAIGLLPDQTPGVGEGVWTAFFGRPAYTMTLVSRLQKATGAAVILAYAERLAAGRGYRLHLQRMPVSEFDEATLNREVEGIIRRCPAQYLWGYNRFKVPAGVAAPQQMLDRA